MTTTLRPTLAATTLDHIRWMRLQGLSETTICQRRHALCRVARHAGVPLRDITEDQLIDWLESLSSLSHLSPVTIYLYVSHISEFYKWVTIRGLRADNPAARLPRPRLPRRLPRPVTETDLAAALDCAPQPIRLWLVLAAWCGLRCKEIALLKRECIRENDTPPVLLVDAGATKGRSERVVPLSSFVTGEIAAAGLPAAGWAFRRADGQPHTPNRVSRLVSEYLHDCDVPATAHMLRHRFGTQAYCASKDLLGVAELMGHASPVTTRGYAKWNSAGAQAIVDALPAPRPCG